LVTSSASSASSFLFREMIPSHDRGLGLASDLVLRCWDFNKHLTRGNLSRNETVNTTPSRMETGTIDEKISIPTSQKSGEASGAGVLNLVGGCVALTAVKLGDMWGRAETSFSLPDVFLCL
jgi:hypothetical protein